MQADLHFNEPKRLNFKSVEGNQTPGFAPTRGINIEFHWSAFNTPSFISPPQLYIQFGIFMPDISYITSLHVAQG